MDGFLNKFAKIEVELAGFAEIKIGFSGGADSTALLILLAKLAERHSFRLEAVHFEHGIRGSESLADADWCRDFVEKRLPAILAPNAQPVVFRMIQLELPSNSPNIEAVARAARMRWWKEIAADPNTAVALGHHADDKIENLFLRLLRGSNATGLTSPRFSREIEGVKFIRPLLGVRRFEIESFLHSNGVEDWRIDRTNADNTQMRNFIRNEVLPLIKEKSPNADKALLRSISAIEDDAVHLEAEAETLYIKARREIRGESTPALDASTVAKLSRALIPRVLRLWLAESLGFDTPPSSDFIERVNSALERRTSKTGKSKVKSELIPLNADTFVKLDGCELRVIASSSVRETSECESILWDWKNEPKIVWNGRVFHARIAISDKAMKESEIVDKTHQKVFFDARLIPERLLLRLRAPGDRMTPFGSDKSVRLKKLLQDSNLTSREKSALPVVATPNGEIIWLPMVRRANFANLPADEENNVLELMVAGL